MHIFNNRMFVTMDTTYIQAALYILRINIKLSVIESFTQNIFILLFDTVHVLSRKIRRVMLLYYLI